MDDSVIIFVATRKEDVEEEWQDSEDMFCEDDCFCEQTMSDTSNDFASLNFKHFSYSVVCEYGLLAVLKVRRVHHNIHIESSVHWNHCVFSQPPSVEGG